MFFAWNRHAFAPDWGPNYQGLFLIWIIDEAKTGWEIPSAETTAWEASQKRISKELLQWRSRNCIWRGELASVSSQRWGATQPHDERLLHTALFSIISSIYLLKAGVSSLLNIKSTTPNSSWTGIVTWTSLAFLSISVNCVLGKTINF